MAILGDSPVVCHAIAHLLEAGGYRTRIVDVAQDEASPTGVDLVLITAGTDPGSRGLAWCADTVHVLWLVGTMQEKEALGKRGLLWPCTARELQDGIASALDAAASEWPSQGPREGLARP